MATTVRYASATKLSMSQTREDIEQLLYKHGADKFAYGNDLERGYSMISFSIRIGKASRQVRMILPVRDEENEQVKKSKWRCLYLAVKAKLVAVDEGISTFENEFMANIVLPSGQTMQEWASPQIEQAYKTNRMPELLPGIESPNRLIEAKK